MEPVDSTASDQSSPSAIAPQGRNLLTWGQIRQGEGRNWDIWISLVMSLVTLLSGCQQPASVGRLPMEGLKLGVLLPATGSRAKFSEPILEVLPLVTNTVNACGGINRAPVSLVVEDEQANPQAVGRTLTQLATEAKVGAVIGAFSDDATAVAALDAAVRYKIPIISPNTASIVLTDRAKKGDFQGFWARTIPSNQVQAVALAQLVREHGLKAVSTVVVNNQDGIRFEQAFVSTFEKLGGTVLGKAAPARYNPQDSELSLIAFTAFTPEGQIPEAVVAALEPESGSLLLESAYAQGLVSGVKLFLTNIGRHPGFIEAVGQDSMGNSLLEGAIGTTPSPGPGNTNFLKIWQTEQSQVPGVYAAQTWDAAALVMLAAQAAGSNQGAAIKAKLQAVANPPGREFTDVCEALQHLRQGEDINYQGASGKVDLDNNGDVVTSYDVWTIDAQGKVKSIDQITTDQITTANP